MAAHCRNIFGDLLLTEPLDSHPVSWSLVNSMISTDELVLPSNHDNCLE